jgi:hypothetical protein
MKAIQQVADAAFIMSDWLGEGGEPVSKNLAYLRSLHCLECKFHGGGMWWEKVKDPIASAIKKALELKHHMKLSLPNEKELEMCLVCGCAMRLKVHVPIKHLKESITPEQNEQYQSVNCWINLELSITT